MLQSFFLFHVNNIRPTKTEYVMCMYVGYLVNSSLHLFLFFIRFNYYYYLDLTLNVFCGLDMFCTHCQYTMTPE